MVKKLLISLVTILFFALLIFFWGGLGDSSDISVMPASEVATDADTESTSGEELADDRLDPAEELEVAGDSTVTEQRMREEELVVRIRRLEREVAEQEAESLEAEQSRAAPSRASPSRTLPGNAEPRNHRREQRAELAELRGRLVELQSEAPREMAMESSGTISVDDVDAPSQTEGPEDAQSVAVDEVSAPTVVKLFYGTSRQRLEQSLGQYLTPAIKPLVCILLFLIIRPVLRRILRRKLQPVTINLMRVVFAVAFVYFFFEAAQTVVQRKQANEMLTVQYGGDLMTPSTDDMQPYELGICHVSIPPIHKPGQVELPDLIYFELKSDPMKHFVLDAIKPKSNAVFFDQLRTRIAESSSQDMFVFVHGFHNTFQDAAFRTAQIAHDLEYPGVPIFFSWPSQGKVLDYPTDENNARIAVEHLKAFLAQLKRESGATNIHLIAHSLGTRALSDALKEMALANADRLPLFNELVLAAPDMSAREFRDIAGILTEAVDRVTLYASSKDLALRASREHHGGLESRAGESEPTPVVRYPVESIDVSYVTDGHSYVSDSGRILEDLGDILTRQRELSTDIAEPVHVGDDEGYWVLR